MDWFETLGEGLVREEVGGEEEEGGEGGEVVACCLLTTNRIVVPVIGAKKRGLRREGPLCGCPEMGHLIKVQDGHPVVVTEDWDLLLNLAPTREDEEELATVLVPAFSCQLLFLFLVRTGLTSPPIGEGDSRSVLDDGRQGWIS